MPQVQSPRTSDAVAVRPPVKRRRNKLADSLPPSAAARPASDVADLRVSDPRLPLAAFGFALVTGIWAYWPTLVEIVATWSREPDYSHGFLVIPVALAFLYLRRESFPGFGAPAYILGTLLVTCGLAARCVGAWIYLSFIDGYSILVWLAGVVALLGGWKLLRWSLPSVAFLFFMIPLPFGLETAMSHPLQRIATNLSCFALQVLGQPAFAEGNVIMLGDQPLEIERACSGLRLFVSMVAVAYVYALLVRRTWWEKSLLFAAVVPVALISNATRITITGLLYQFATGELARRFAHDWAGYAMILLAMALFASVLWLMSKVLREEEVLEMSALVRRAKT